MEKAHFVTVVVRAMQAGNNHWVNPTHMTDLQHALDFGMLYVPMLTGRYWLARRNGATRTWKRDPKRFRIPVKYGFRGCSAITETTDMTLLRIAASREDAEYGRNEGEPRHA